MTRSWKNSVRNRLLGRSAAGSSKTYLRRRKQRRLKPETLESRQLLAANMFHNDVMPEDVNEDGVVTAADALMIVNEITRDSPEFAEAEADLGLDSGVDRGRGRRTDVNNDGRRTSRDALMVINRLSRDRLGRQDPQDNGDTQNERPAQNERPDRPATDQPETPVDELTEVRSIDGTGNNLENPDLGAANSTLLRVADNDYADGISEPAGEDRPSAREISNALSAADPDGNTSERNLSSFVFMWGQFLDHDIDLSLEPDSEESAESFDIEVPTGDALFDPFATGEATIHLTRSDIAEGTGTSTDNPAEQVNAITAWIDGSQVYGSDQETADALREFIGGRMLITEDGLLPTDEEGNLLAGDIRAAENLTLTSMHALFVREHNQVADEIAASSPDLSDEQIYQQARSQVIATLQSITFNEYLPALLGEGAISQYGGYDADVNSQIANEFSTAAFRFGHSTLNDNFRFVGNDGQEVDESVALAGAFFNPSMLEETGIDSLLKYGASTLSQEIDLQVVDSLRNFLFGPPGAGGLDLVSLNIQRGRDHGLSDFNSTRVAYGLDAYESFDQITSDVDVQQNLESLYGDVNNIDLWVGLMAEDHAEGGSLGETSSLIIADQFERLRDGDRLWYENIFSGRELREIEQTSLSDVIERNTNIDSLQSNVFFFAPEISGRVVADAANGQPASNVAANDRNNRRGQDRQDRPPQMEGVAGMTIELLDSSGTVMDSTTTDQSGRYSFESVDESGVYEVRIAQSNEVVVVGSDSWDLTISNGEERMGHVDFEVVV